MTKENTGLSGELYGFQRFFSFLNSRERIHLYPLDSAKACVEELHRKGMDGSGVWVPIVDSGVNMAYLNSHGKHPNFDAQGSWAWDPMDAVKRMPLHPCMNVVFGTPSSQRPDDHVPTMAADLACGCS